MMKGLLLCLIRAYQWTKPLRPDSCRFYPSCSAYCYGSVCRHGVLKGLTLTVWRLLKCHPLCAGGLDEVPQNFADAFPKLSFAFRPQPSQSRSEAAAIGLKR